MIFGQNSKQLKQDSLIDVCSNCKKIAKIDIHVIQKYAHVFWIPTFPMEKLAISHCNNCGFTFKTHQMPPSIKAIAYKLEKESKTPIELWTGLGIFGFIFVLGFFQAALRILKSQNNLNDPKINDVVEVKINQGFTLYRIDSIVRDSVFVCVNNYGASSQEALNKIKEKNSFSNKTLSFSNQNFKGMFFSGEIINVDRKQ